jgi:HAE1 family hydrophobic/amphiphilic exporter-1
LFTFIKRSVRKLFSSAINSSFITGWCRWSYWFRLSLRIENNIYFQVALIMLIGLLAKNAILIVEFAIQRRRNGMDLTKAVEGARARLRPILMTSLAFIFGLLPLALASGVAVGNRSIGMGAVGGMLVDRFGVFVILCCL